MADHVTGGAHRFAFLQLGDIVPIGHWVGALIPTNGQFDPNGQIVHCVAPALGEYDPGEHRVATVALHHEPGGHGSGAERPGAGHTVPDGQAVHEAAVKPVAAENVPAGHSETAVLGSWHHAPTGHTVQDDEERPKRNPVGKRYTQWHPRSRTYPRDRACRL